MFFVSSPDADGVFVISQVPGKIKTISQVKDDCNTFPMHPRWCLYLRRNRGLQDFTRFTKKFWYTIHIINTTHSWLSMCFRVRWNGWGALWLDTFLCQSHSTPYMGITWHTLSQRFTPSLLRRRTTSFLVPHWPPPLTQLWHADIYTQITIKRNNL